MSAHELRPLDNSSRPQRVVLWLTRGKPLAVVVGGLALMFMLSLAAYETLSPAPAPVRTPSPVPSTAHEAGAAAAGTSFPGRAPSRPALAPSDVPRSAAVAGANISASDTPAVSPGATSTPVLLDEDIARGLLQRYYEAIKRRDYQAAYGLLTAKWRQRQPYGDFAGGYAATRRDILTIAAAGPASQAGTNGYVLSVDVVAQTTSGRTQHFNGLYFVILEGGKPKIDSGRLTPVST